MRFAVVCCFVSLYGVVCVCMNVIFLVLCVVLCCCVLLGVVECLYVVYVVVR